jgi:hypothetical protein
MLLKVRVDEKLTSAKLTFNMMISNNKSTINDLHMLYYFR